MNEAQTGSIPTPRWEGLLYKMELPALWLTSHAGWPRSRSQERRNGWKVVFAQVWTADEFGSSTRTDFRYSGFLLRKEIWFSEVSMVLCLVSVHSGRLRTASMNKAQSRILNCAGGPEKERRRNPTPSLYLQLTQLRTDASLLLLNELING